MNRQGSDDLGRRYKGELRKLEIMRAAARRFLKDGYTNTHVSYIAKELKISPGNLTFHYPAKEDMLAELVELLGGFQQEMVEREISEGYSSIMAICLELAAMASMCEDDEITKDFYISAYRSPLCLEIIRKNDTARAKEVFKEYCQSWSNARFEEAEILVSGIEYSTLMSTHGAVSLELRIEGALDTILSIYNVPEELRKTKIDRVLSMDYHKIGHGMMNDFKDYVEKTSLQVLMDLQTQRRKEYEPNIG